MMKRVGVSTKQRIWHAMKRNEIIQFLQSSRFFRNLAHESVCKVASLCREAAFDSGESVFRQGDSCDHLYIIIDGQVHLERTMNMGDRRGRVVIDTLGKGRTLGCWSALLGDPHEVMSTATCQKPTVLLMINGRDLRQMMMAKSSFGFEMMERLCFLLRDRLQAAYGAMDRF
jgi:signal-transduction protein with cAMP-binding, CBS, and nucleotidyltransferase domain